MFNTKHALPIKGLLPLVLITFIYDLSITFLSPSYPVFLSGFFAKEAYVGYLAAGFALLTIIFSFIVAKFLEKIKKITMLKIGLLGFAVTLLILPNIHSLKSLIIVEFFRAFFLTASILPMSLLIRETATKKKLGKTEGLYFTATNLAWMAGPLIGGLLARAYNIESIFYLSAIFPVISFIILNYLKFHEFNRTHIIHKNILTNFKDFAQYRNLIIICIMTIFLLFWWSIIYTFVPLFIKNSGLGVHITGYTLFLVVVPLILLEIPAGNLADKFGYKKFFIMGFLLMAIFPILSIFTTSTALTLIFIILASIGAAFVEPLREAYFFESINRKDEIRFYPIYRVAVPLGQLFGPIIFSTILLFSNFKLVFLCAGGFSLVGLVAAIFLKEVYIKNK